MNYFNKYDWVWVTAMILVFGSIFWIGLYLTFNDTATKCRSIKGDLSITNTCYINGEKVND